MIYIVTAVYAEAKALIDKYGLKRTEEISHFQTFLSDKVRLIVGGVGKVGAAVAVTELCCTFKPNAEDILVNIGIAGAKSGRAEASGSLDGAENSLTGRNGDRVSVGSLFLAASVTDCDDRRRYYPDLLQASDIPECSVMTVSKPFCGEAHGKDNSYCGELYRKDNPFCGEPYGKDNLDSGSCENHKEEPGLHSLPVLYDMEASGVCQAAVHFFSQNRIAFLKVVSDFGADNEGNVNLSMKAVSDLVTDALPHICGYIEALERSSRRTETFSFSEKEEELIGQLAQKLFLSVSMERTLRQLVRYLKLSGKDTEAELKKRLMEADSIGISKKVDGKRFFEQMNLNYTE